MTRWLHALLRTLLRGAWFVLIPLACAGLVLRYLVPHSLTAPGFEGKFAAAVRPHTLLLAIATFVAFTALIRYWRSFLPGGRYLSALPFELVERVPRRRIAVCEEASGLLDWLEGRAGKRWLAAHESEGALVEARTLRVLLDTGKWSRVGAASSQLQELVRAGRRSRDFTKNLAFVGLLGCAALLAVQLRARYVQFYEVLGTSMLPTLTPDELLAGRAVKYAPSQLPMRGDVVVLRVAVGGTERELIKRVIGLPGDRIAMRGGHPMINGWFPPVCDAGAYYSPDDETARAGDPGGRVQLEFLEGRAYPTFQTTFAVPMSEYVVKPGEVFLIGDNRSNSRDSRNFEAGAPRGFPLSAISARVTRVLLARTRSGALDATSVWQPLGTSLKLEGTDMSQVEAGVQRCLALRPKDTTPPTAASVALLSGLP